ncbi:MAG: ABC transporter ATP-binding protein [Candidatus Aminicenantes bacterium]|nr:ABC transporter ATP-binding protein [Candidatus Aminicenantes bacterium]
MFDLLKLTFREKKLVALSFLATIFVAFFSYVFVDMVQPIIDEMFGLGAQTAPAKFRFMDVIFRWLSVGREDIRNVLPLIVVVVIFGKGLFSFLSSFFMKVVGNKIVKSMRDDLYGRILYQSTSYFDRVTTGDLMARLTNDVDKIQQAVSSAMSDMIEESFILAALLVQMFVRDWQLALMSFVITPLAVVPLAAFSRQLKKKGLQSQVRMGQIYDLLHETIGGNKIVKAFTMEQFELKKFLKATAGYFRINLKLAWISSLSSPFMEFIGGAVGAFILFIGTKRIAAGLISPGDFGAYIMAIFWMFMPIKRLSRANNVIQQAAGCYGRIQEVLQSPSQVQDSDGAYALPEVKGHVRFEDVGFSYDKDRPVLFDVDFEVQPNKMVAIVGLSGAGKTTIINLLSRFYEPTSGRITIDGIDIRDVTLASLRSQIGLVTQDIILFNDSVRNNIAYGLEQMPEDRIVAAARAAECHGFITELPEGYAAMIGERGSLLSSGQRQRLAIARALLKDPPILILDEATSALDSESERLIQTALANIMKNRTTFVIAHRLSTIRNADMILVVDKGRITESGTHEALMKKEGIYRMLHDLQFPEVEETA